MEPESTPKPPTRTPNWNFPPRAVSAQEDSAPTDSAPAAAPAAVEQPATRRTRSASLSPVERTRRRNRIVGVSVGIAVVAAGGAAFGVAWDHKQARLEQQAEESYETARERCLQREQEGLEIQTEPVTAAVADLEELIEQARTVQEMMPDAQAAEATALAEQTEAAREFTVGDVELVIEQCSVAPGPAAQGLASFEVEVVTGTDPALDDVTAAASRLQDALAAAEPLTAAPTDSSGQSLQQDLDASTN